MVLVSAAPGLSLVIGGAGDEKQCEKQRGVLPPEEITADSDGGLAARFDQEGGQRRGSGCRF